LEFRSKDINTGFWSVDSVVATESECSSTESLQYQGGDQTEQEQYQLQIWVYETSNMNLTFVERLERMKWEVPCFLRS
jgi:hypothetical protein